MIRSMTSSNPPIVADDRFVQLVRKHGVADAARLMHKRYSTVRDAAKQAGITIKRGRRRSAKIEQRNAEIFRLRKEEKLYLADIGFRFHIGRERVRQILEDLGGDPLQSFLTPDEVKTREKRAVFMRKDGASVSEIADKVDLSPARIRDAILNAPGGDPLGLLGVSVRRAKIKSASERHASKAG